MCLPCTHRTQSRATAIDALHKALRDVGSKAVLLPTLQELVRFLVGLVADPNFKISISAMSIVGDLASRVGRDLEPHLRRVPGGKGKTALPCWCCICLVVYPRYQLPSARTAPGAGR